MRELDRGKRECWLREEKVLTEERVEAKGQGERDKRRKECGSVARVEIVPIQFRRKNASKRECWQHKIIKRKNGKQR